MIHTKDFHVIRILNVVIPMKKNQARRSKIKRPKLHSRKQFTVPDAQGNLVAALVSKYILLIQSLNPYDAAPGIVWGSS